MAFAHEVLVGLFVWLVGGHLSAAVAEPRLGFTQVAQADGGRTTVFYPTAAVEQPVRIGPFQLSWAAEAAPTQGNGHLIVVSHGSGGSPWVHADLARTLVSRGFVVAMPQHRGDNNLDDAHPGPDSWALRPREVSEAIDALAAQPQFAPGLTLDAVGVFGGSAGGHTALSLAGGLWSPSRFRDHCERNIEVDFSSCVGFITLLRGNWLDPIKVWVARQVIGWRFRDERLEGHTDSRVRAVVAMVPFAADFQPESLANPRTALGLVIAARDVNQVPAFHAEAVRAACAPRCDVLMHLPEAGHGAMLSPLPPFPPGSVADRLLGDPPFFDRGATLPRLHERIADYFVEKLGR
ncbi:dienelactone hydrolase [Sphaerotilus montanus]|uniref:Putative dienelactone hydrolase n=1 Tax=Sphaerotilus montanus TaxID=522889 RepID=A0A7Y9QWD2_9BURK|nr:dienelactone hydrolase [Sphaerotilus montanus]NYG32662.1 putative dienelactone hydrolase [Sphaerotilus montanus]NZD57899.1 dienelactone hydrolase [Sphaerotilus montanus]